MLKFFLPKNPHNKNRQGFTLTELTICCLIIAIIAVIAVPAYMQVRFNMEEQKAITTLHNIYKAQKLFWFENTDWNGVPTNFYASSLAELNGAGSQTLWGSGTYENLIDEDGDWSYAITSGDATTFEATATNLDYNTWIITIDQHGSIGGLDTRPSL